MRTPNGSVPSYRRHKARNLAVVTLNGRCHYLGPYGCAASRREYDRLIAEWLAAGRRVHPPQFTDPLGIPPTRNGPDPLPPGSNLSIAELVLGYYDYCQEAYRKNGRPTSRLHNVRDALHPLNELYGDQPVGGFGPLKLKAVRQTFIDRGLCRSTVNKHVGSLKRAFRWGTENELVPPSVYHALQAVGGLRRGRSAARETCPIKPVAEEAVAAVLPWVSPQVAAMIRLQELTGMRPGEVVLMRGGDLETTGRIWVYTPASHKTEHHRVARHVYLGPKAQEVLRPFLKSDVSAYLFDPRAAVAAQRARRRASRRTPLTPSHQARRPSPRPKVAAKERYTTESYRRAIARACDRAAAAAAAAAAAEDGGRGFPQPAVGVGSGRTRASVDVTALPIRAAGVTWHPNQLRHNAATRLRKEFGIEAARVVLGHQSAAVTEVYAELDRARAAEVMGRVG